MNKALYGWAESVHGMIQVVKQTNKMHIDLIRAFVEQVHLVQANAASDRIYTVWLVNDHIDSDSYWTVN